MMKPFSLESSASVSEILGTFGGEDGRRGEQREDEERGGVEWRGEEGRRMRLYFGLMYIGFHVDSSLSLLNPFIP